MPGLRGVTFLAVAGIGLAALFTDLLAVRLRKAAAAGLPLLALFSATVASKASAPTIDEAAIFCAGVAGYLALLVADGRERIQLWGRLVSGASGRLAQTRRRHSEPRSGQAGTARRPDATGPGPRPRTGPGSGASLCPIPMRSPRPGAASAWPPWRPRLLVPLLIPGLHVRDLFGGGPGGDGQGGGSLVQLPDPVVQLDQQLHRTSARTILTYHSDNTDPPYLRIYALDLTPTAVSWGLFLQQVASLGGDSQMPGAPGLADTPSPVSRIRA